MKELIILFPVFNFKLFYDLERMNDKADPSRIRTQNV